jgi:hypothetical protein
MPSERAIAMFGSYPAAIVRKQFWWDGPLVDAIEASKDRCRQERGEHAAPVGATA